MIVHYLRLALWPHPLVLDYAWRPVDTLSATLPSVALVLALLAATLWSLYRKSWVGFWGAWFFLILAPTSSILPIADLAFEHRMYLPLAAVVVVAVVGGHGLLESLFATVGHPGEPPALGGDRPGRRGGRDPGIHDDPSKRGLSKPARHVE